ncbi:uncharacterized protein LY79DRAFT_686158 [Colletotrichum navitas]|uniref:C2H2-type domain-containing protein n=1 Tax=Colletotrichum navitas TaxID=681940 RepID=A0AAD8PZX8_9PEZI|nr:uncharacterized protein LY79DRAFT_686158 [Colletotrichum navitas]KAK1593228.1 hypothetical protein LY79DRAFT_686158 [Colletotrichum navitas]
MGMDPAKQGQMVPIQDTETVADMPTPSGQRFHHKTPMPWSLMEFYGGEQPWVPSGIFGASQQGRQALAPDIQRRTNGNFQGWRSTLPSECDTVPSGFPPSDSGYESRTKHSIENTSVFNDVDRSQDTQSLSGQVMDYHPFSITPTDGGWDNMASTPVPSSQSGAFGSRLVCPDCQAPCKTKSELNKHNQRHRKAYICNVSGCTRKEGFGTLNDLDRHKGSVHPDVFNAGPRYRCHIGSCQTKDKIWPRADNFRQHLKRVHQRHIGPEDDLSEYLLQSSLQRPQDGSFQQNAQDDLEGVGSELFNSYNAGPMAWDDRPTAFEEIQEEIQLSPQEEAPMPMDLILDPSLTRTDGSASGASLGSSEVDVAASKVQLHNQIPDLLREPGHHEFVQPKEITRTLSPKAVVGAKRDGSYSFRTDQHQSTPIDISSDREPDVLIPERTQSRPLDGSLADSIDCDAATKTPTHQALVGSSGEKQPIEQAEQPINQPPSLLQNKSQEVIFDLLSQLPKNVIETFLKNQTEAAPQKPASAPITTTNSQHQCPHSTCQKGFNRKCELKKHMKRHEKPYGCTFSNCKKRFGSKNDWKRHENSQHFQVEMWKCHEKRADNESETCGKVCHRRETFRSHLAREHKMNDTAQVDKALEKCRVGRNGDPRFWCGFCSKIVEIPQKGATVWAGRFNHIDDHYAGRNNQPKKEHSDWVAINPYLPKVDLTGSPNDSSDAESADEGPVVVDSQKPGGDTPKAVSCQTRKRRLRDDEDNDEDDDEQNEPKRIRTYRWFCCTCKWDADCKLNDNCINFNCNHRRCDNCEIQCVTIRDKKEAHRSTKKQT